MKRSLAAALLVSVLFLSPVVHAGDDVRKRSFEITFDEDCSDDEITEAEDKIGKFAKKQKRFGGFVAMLDAFEERFCALDAELKIDLKDGDTLKDVKKKFHKEAKAVKKTLKELHRCIDDVTQLKHK